MRKISAFAGAVALALGMAAASGSAFAGSATVDPVCPPVNQLDAASPGLTDDAAPAVTDTANGDCKLTQQSLSLSEQHVVHHRDQAQAQTPVEPVPESSAVH